MTLIQRPHLAFSKRLPNRSSERPVVGQHQRLAEKEKAPFGWHNCLARTFKWQWSARKYLAATLAFTDSREKAFYVAQSSSRYGRIQGIRIKVSKIESLRICALGIDGSSTKTKG